MAILINVDLGCLLIITLVAKFKQKNYKQVAHLFPNGEQGMLGMLAAVDTGLLLKYLTQTLNITDLFIKSSVFNVQSIYK